MRLGSHAEAAMNLERAIGLFDQRIRAEPHNRSNAQNFAGAQAVLAEALVQDGKIQAALDHLRESVRISDELAAELPEMITVQLDVAARHATLGHLLAEKMHDFAAARVNFERARDIFRKLETERQLPDDWKGDLHDVEAGLAKLR